jgi:hypothetical protein
MELEKDRHVQRRHASARGENMLSTRPIDVPIQVHILEQLADSLEALLEAVQSQDNVRIVDLEKESQKHREDLNQAGQIDSSQMTYESLTSLRSALARIKPAENKLLELSQRRAPAQVDVTPAREPSSLETQFMQVLEASMHHDFSQFIPKPKVFESSGGHPLFGYDTDNFHRAALHLTAHADRGRYLDSLELIGTMEHALQVEKMRVNFLGLVFPKILWDKYYAPIKDGRTRVPVMELLIQLYAAESGREVSEIIEILDGSADRGFALWERVVPDEDNPTYEQLSAFYNGRNFPEGDCVPGILKSNIGTAFRLVPVLIAQRFGLKSAFDYGGGAGLSISALKAHGCERAVLIEENRRMLEFASWRDKESGIEGAEYLPESQLCDDIKAHTNRYDFGVCTEVLEHVIAVEDTVKRMARLIRSGGYLYQTASFGLYPHLSHLKPNLRFAGKEDELMASVGFERVALDISTPTLASQRLYRRR